MRTRPIVACMLAVALALLSVGIAARAMPAEQDQQQAAQAVAGGAVNLDFLGQLGGASYAVAVQGNRAALGVGPSLVILDVTNPVTPTVLGEARLPGLVAGVCLSGTYAYVATGEAGLRIVDLTYPVYPLEVGYYDTPGTAKDVGVHGGHAFVADNDWGLCVVDVNDPTSPREVGSCDTPGRAIDLCLSGDGALAYVADQAGGLRIIDISVPTDPSPWSSCDSYGPAVAVALSGQYAYVAWHQYTGGGLQTVDVSNPADPRVVNWPREGPGMSGGIYDVAVAGNHAYVGGHRLHVVDISDPIHPAAVNAVSAPGWTYGLCLAGGRAYLAQHDNGLYILDVATDPASPALLGAHRRPGGPARVFVDGRYACTFHWYFGGMQILDVANPRSPQWVASYPYGDDHSFAGGGYAYVTEEGQFRVISLANPQQPQQVGACSAGVGTGQIHVSGDHAYIAADYGGLQIIDISNRAGPVPRGSCLANMESTGVFVREPYAYVADLSYGLRIVDVSNKDLPVEVGACTVGSLWRVHVAGNYAYAADASLSYLRIYNIANPQQPYQVAVYDTPGNVADVYVSGPHAYVSDGLGGVLVLDVSDPAHPAPVASRDTPGGASSLSVAGDRLYVADGEGGLAILGNAAAVAPAISGVVPPEGAWLGSHLDHTGYLFSPGAFGDAVADTVTVTHTVLTAAPSAYPQLHYGHIFDVRAVYKVSGLPAEIVPGQTYTLTIRYAPVAAPAIEATLGLYYWDGSQWVEEPTAVVDMMANAVVATPDHLSYWSLIGEPSSRVFLPLTMRQ